MADQWYAKFTGSSAAGSDSGLSVGQEYTMLSGIGLHWLQIPANPVSVKLWLSYGYPVLICGAEIGFFDVGAGKVPYPWTPSGNHCIVACGIRANGNILVRDYANTLNSPGSIREYDANKMALISATAVTPHWKTPFITPTVPTLPVPTPATPAIEQQMADTWAYFLGGNAAPYDSGIARDWKALYPKMNFGSPLGMEKDSVSWDGTPIKVQLFSGGIRCEHSSKDHISRWYDAEGKQIA